jgi:GcrA cell cycle regulator
MSEIIGWTDERVARLKKLWQDGLSAIQIAARLGGVTRNAVISKVHRCGFSGRKPRANVRTILPPKPRVVSKRVAAVHGRPEWHSPSTEAHRARAQERTVLSLHPFALPENTAVVALIDLEEHHCRFPLGEPNLLGYCGKPKVKGLSYCEHHSQICYATRSVASRVEAVQPALADPLRHKEREYAG